MKCSEADLTAGFAALGLVLPAAPADQPVNVEIGNEVWWLNQDSRGGVWINGREKRKGEAAPAPSTAPAEAADARQTSEAIAPATNETPVAPAAEAPTTAELPLATAETSTEAAAPAATPAREPQSGGTPETTVQPLPENVLPAVRLLLKETRTGSLAGKIDRVASEINKTADELTSALVSAGLKVPEKSREKPVFVEHAGEIFWFNKNAKGELWVNAKASKYQDGTATAESETSSTPSAGDKRPRRGNRPKKPTDSAAE
jgi:hypothetical protein